MEELLLLYKEFILYASKLTKELSLKDNSISMSKVINYLIINGNFSCNNNFSKTSKLYLMQEPGFNILAGRGCCSHTSFLAKDIFNINGIDCDIAGFNIGKQKSMIESANHAANIIKYEDNIYVSDSYNGIFLRFLSEYEVYLINKKLDDVIKLPDNNVLKWYYAPMFEYTFIQDGNNISWLYKRLEEFKNASNGDYITGKMLDEIMSETMENIKKKNESILDFESDTSKIKQKVKTSIATMNFN